MNDLDKVMERLKGVTDLLEGIPEGASVLQEIRDGSISTQSAVVKLLAIAHRHQLLGSLVSASEEIRAIVPGGSVPWDSSKRPIKMKTRTSISQLNPLLEAAISERAFFDGDVPEFRTGPIPEGGSPAVPVITESLDPVVVGEMLRRASKGVAAEIQLAVKNRDFICGTLLNMAEEGNQAMLEATVRNLPPVPTGVPGYMAGQTAALRVIKPPTRTELEKLTPEDRAALVHSCIVTTQGRVSLAPAIEREVRKRLSGHVLVDEREHPHNDLEKREFDWTAELFENINENYHFTTAAVAYFVEKAKAAVAEGFRVPETGIALMVIPLNAISDRRFGWSMRIGCRKGRVSC